MAPTSDSAISPTPTPSTRSGRPTLKAVIAAAAVASLIAAGCGSEDGSSADTSSTTNASTGSTTASTLDPDTPSTTEAATGDTSTSATEDPGAGAETNSAMSFVSMLERVPNGLATGDGRIELYFGDVVAAEAVIGRDRPSTEDIDIYLEHLGLITGLPNEDGPSVIVPFTLFPQQRLVDLDEIEAELGWTVADVDWFIEMNLAPESFGVFGGTFDEAKLTAAMGEPNDGVWGIGNDSLEVDISQITPARRLGESVQIAHDNGALIMSKRSQLVRRALADGERLSDVTELRAIAEALHDRDAYAGAILANYSFSAGPDVGPSTEGMFLPAEFTAIGVGFGPADQTSVAYWHTDEAAAQANADALAELVAEGTSVRRGAPWSELIASVEIEVDGPLVVARLHLTDNARPDLLLQSIMARDGLAAHE